MKIKTPIKAIRAMCLKCAENSYRAIRECSDNECPIWPYRMGKRPDGGLEITKKKISTEIQHFYGNISVA